MHDFWLLGLCNWDAVQVVLFKYSGCIQLVSVWSWARSLRTWQMQRSLPILILRLLGALPHFKTTLVASFASHIIWSVSRLAGEIIRGRAVDRPVLRHVYRCLEWCKHGRDLAIPSFETTWAAKWRCLSCSFSSPLGEVREWASCLVDLYLLSSHRLHLGSQPIVLVEGGVRVMSCTIISWLQGSGKALVKSLAWVLQWNVLGCKCFWQSSHFHKVLLLLQMIDHFVHFGVICTLYAFSTCAVASFYLRTCVFDVFYHFLRS